MCLWGLDQNLKLRHLLLLPKLGGSSTLPNEPLKRPILSLQYVRGIAALMVVYFHASGEVQRLGGHALPLDHFGPAGVDLFFVISGFIMWVTTSDGKAGPRSFMVQRITRVLPLYWTLTLFIASVALVAPNLLSSTKFDSAHLLASLAFIPWPNPGFNGYFPVVIPGWTLNYEMMFYAIFTVCLFFPRRWCLAAALAILCALPLSRGIWPQYGVYTFYTDPAVLEFAAGLVIGAAFTARTSTRFIVIVEIMITATLLGALASVSSLPGVVVFGLPAALIVCALVFLERKHGVPCWAGARALGDASYSLYLTHAIVLAAFTRLWLAAALPIRGIFTLLFIVASIAATVCVAWATYRLIEVPLIAVARRWQSPSRGRQAATSSLTFCFRRFAPLIGTRVAVIAHSLRKRRSLWPFSTRFAVRPSGPIRPIGWVSCSTSRRTRKLQRRNATN
jgi:exopolysaccharide production protein ExoZ